MELHNKELVAFAEVGYKEKGLGHLMVICGKGSVGLPENSARYVSQSEEQENVRNVPLSRDPGLERMVNEYDPKSQCVIVAFSGTHYKTIRTATFVGRVLPALAKFISNSQFYWHWFVRARVVPSASRA